MPPKGGNAKKEGGRAKKAENEAKKQQAAEDAKVYYITLGMQYWTYKLRYISRNGPRRRNGLTARKGRVRAQRTRRPVGKQN